MELVTEDMENAEPGGLYRRHGPADMYRDLLLCGRTFKMTCVRQTTDVV